MGTGTGTNGTGTNGTTNSFGFAATGGVPKGVTMKSLVGMVVMSSDRQVLGIIQEAKEARGGVLLQVQVNDALGIPHDRVRLQLRSVTPRNGQIRLKSSAWQFRQQLS